MSFFKLCNNTGLKDETNICFLNAALHALNSLNVCREFFVNRDYDPGDLQFPICDEISRIFKFSGSQFVASAGTSEVGPRPSASFGFASAASADQA